MNAPVMRRRAGQASWRRWHSGGSKRVYWLVIGLKGTRAFHAVCLRSTGSELGNAGLRNPVRIPISHNPRLV